MERWALEKGGAVGQVVNFLGVQAHSEKSNVNYSNIQSPSFALSPGLSDFL